MITGMIFGGIMFFLGVLVGFWAATTEIPSVSTNCKEEEEKKRVDKA